MMNMGKKNEKCNSTPSHPINNMKTKLEFVLFVCLNFCMEYRRLEVEGAEQTKRVKQRDIAQNVDAQSRRKVLIFSFFLSFWIVFSHTSVYVVRWRREHTA